MLQMASSILRRLARSNEFWRDVMATIERMLRLQEEWEEADERYEVVKFQYDMMTECLKNRIVEYTNNR